MSRIVPILFNTDMVRAILNGKKTVTRRLAKSPKDFMFDGGTSMMTAGKHGEMFLHMDCVNVCNNAVRYIRCPYRINDVLYVRETWGDYSEQCDGGVGYYLYRADYPDGATTFVHDDGVHTCGLPKWHPSIHMPKEAARIWLKVTNIRVERLQDITESGARKEGCEDDIEYALGNPAVYYFANLWNQTINKKDIDLYSWEANPWVWVIEFERCEEPKEDKNK